VVVRVNTNIAVNLMGKCMNAIRIEVMMVIKVNTTITINLMVMVMMVLKVNTTITINLMVMVMMVIKVNTTITTNLLGKCKKGKRTATALGSTGRWGGRGVTAQLVKNNQEPCRCHNFTCDNVRMLHKIMSEGYM